MIKKLAVIAFLIFAATPAWAMKTPMFGGSTTTPSTSVANYMGFGSAPVATNDQAVRSITPVAGIIQGLYVNVVTAPGSGKSYTFTLEKNGSDTTIACTVADSNTSCSELNKTAVLAAGDNFSVKVVPSGTPAATVTSFSTVFDSGTGGASLIYSSANNVSPSTGSTETDAISGAIGWANANNLNVIPTAGTIGNLYVLAKTAPGAGASGKQYVFTIQKNSSNTSLTCTMFETATTCNDTTGGHFFTVVAGDTLRIQAAPTSTPTAGNPVIAVSFAPTVDGESVYMGAYGGGASSTSVDNFQRIQNMWGGYTATEANIAVPVPIDGIVARKFYSTQGSASGASKSYIYALRQNAASTALTCTITGASATSCNDTTDSVTLSQGQTIDYILSPSNTPSATTSHRLSVVLFIDPQEHIYNSTVYDSTLY